MGNGGSRAGNSDGPSAGEAVVDGWSQQQSFYSNFLMPIDHMAKARDAVISLDNVHKTYLLGVEGVPALRGVDMTIKKGEFVFIVGTSGGGKTSLLNIVGTIDKPTKGEVSICGVRLSSRTPDEVLADVRLRKLGFVFQTFNLISSMTALENVELPMILAGNRSAHERKRSAMALLKSVGIAHRADHFPTMLSGGEQQRVTIARALANEPEVLLLDEPTGDLDTDNSYRIMDQLLRLNEEKGITMVMVTHDMALKNFGNRVIHMRDGKQVFEEVIGTQVRLRMQEELRLKIAELNAQPKNVDAVERTESFMDTKLGMPPNAALFPSGHVAGINEGRTDIRQPEHYATFVNVATREERQSIASNTRPVGGAGHSRSRAASHAESELAREALSSLNIRVNDVDDGTIDPTLLDDVRSMSHSGSEIHFGNGHRRTASMIDWDKMQARQMARNAAMISNAPPDMAGAPGKGANPARATDPQNYRIPPTGHRRTISAGVPQLYPE